MKLEQYSELRNKITGQSYEDKYYKLEMFTYTFSWLGNLGSIFFAYFLLFPATLKAVENNLSSGDVGMYISTFVTILFLVGYELIKREVISNTSFDLIKNKFKISKKFVGLILLSLSLIAGSFYFSLNGAKNFANNKKEDIEIVNVTYQNQIDSLSAVYDQKKNVYIEDNNVLMNDNRELRNKITETPINYVNTRKEYQEIIDKNIQVIETNDNKINELDLQLNNKINQLIKQKEETRKSTVLEENESIYLFLVISTFIEFLIILGVYFRQFYLFNVYLENEDELEKITRKKERYLILLKFLYKDGDATVGEKIMGISRLKDLIDEKTNITDPSKFVDEFIDDTTYLGIIKLKGKRRILNLDYEKAIEKIKTHDDSFRILETLK